MSYNHVIVRMYILKYGYTILIYKYNKKKETKMEISTRRYCVVLCKFQKLRNSQWQMKSALKTEI